MTTILADFGKGVMVADSAISDGDRVWTGRKVWRIGKSLIGFAGELAEAHAMVAWLKSGAQGKQPVFSHSMALLLGPDGLFYYAASQFGTKVESGVEAIGTGAKSAMCAYEAMGFADPKRAVSIVCKHDNASRLPVRTYRMKPCS